MARPRWQRLTIKIVKWTVTLVVLWAVARHVLRTWIDLRDQSRSFHFEPGWLIVSGILYIAGLVACGRFFERILRASPTPVRLFPAVRAYLVSHLGKYVPGKAMVVVVRAGMVVPFGARASTAAIATFYETLVMMASGGLIAAAGFATAAGSGRSAWFHAISFTPPIWGPVTLPLYRLGAWGGLGLGLAFVFLTVPPVFGRLAGWVSLPIPGVGPEAMPRFTSRLLVQGLLWTSCGWILLGLSQLAVVRSFDPAGTNSLIAFGLVPVVIASVALATVSGFVVAVLPGGLGVREGVLMSALAPAIGSDQAVIASLLLRLVWVAAELAAAAILFPLFRRPPADGESPLQAGPDYS
jgi:glycosyltransferase 2 family protein